MSGHSKWATIRRKKEILDSKKGAVFTKLSKNITLAARDGGGDESTNFKLRLAIEKAKQANMPKDNIERAIKKGAGGLDGVIIEEITYEGFGPAGSAFIIEVVTDNRNRASAEMRHVFSKAGGNLGATGAVSWQFDHKGLITVPTEEYLPKKDEAELELIDAGVEDIKEKEDFVDIVMNIEDLQKVKEIVDKIGLSIDSAGLEWLAKEEVAVDEIAIQKVEKFMDALDALDDVQNFYTNVSLAD